MRDDDIGDGSGALTILAIVGPLLLLVPPDVWMDTDIFVRSARLIFGLLGLLLR